MLSACARPDTAGVVGIMAIPINLKCTTCDDFIRCAESAKPTEAGTVYRLKEKTFWAQIATIGDYLTQLFRDKTRDERPMAIYRDSAGGRVTLFDPEWRAVIDVAASRITVLDRSIDQKTGALFDQSNQRIGLCAPMPRREGYAMVREFLGKPALVGAQTNGGAQR